ncbi:MAG: ABC transporter ATP-binding protein [Geminicoccaceae bacterium]|nr:ABC transporter ATP-binding protein [Geminicoccaceae bacterium]
MRLEARGLAFGHGGRTVGEGVDLDVGPGDVLCLLGPNGCGKTTLMKTLLGLLPAKAGRIRLDGAPLDSLGRRGTARRVAYVPQAHAALFPFPVLDVVTMGRTAHMGLFAGPGPKDRAAALDALDALGVARLAPAVYTEISGGERQLVLVARALVQGSPLLVMDEPTASLDVGNQARVLAAVRRLAAGGLGVVLSTHDPGHAFLVGTRAALLHDGRIRAQGPPAAVLTPARLEAAYGVPVAVERLPSGRVACVFEA